MIKSEQLSYTYAGSSEALAFADVDVAQGSVVVLRGPSGSGKSTWLALAAGLVRPTSGQLIVAGQSLCALGKMGTDAWRAQTVGFLPQKLHLTSALSITDNLRMAQWAVGAKEDKTRIRAVLETLGIGELAKRFPSQLSGGQAQRAALARAVLLSPKIILADEPTASLDDEAASESIELLLSTAVVQGATLVIATHDRRVTRQLENATAHASTGYTEIAMARRHVQAELA